MVPWNSSFFVPALSSYPNPPFFHINRSLAIAFAGTGFDPSLLSSCAPVCICVTLNEQAVA